MKAKAATTAPAPPAQISTELTRLREALLAANAALTGPGDPELQRAMAAAGARGDGTRSASADRCHGRFEVKWCTVSDSSVHRQSESCLSERRYGTRTTHGVAGDEEAPDARR